MASDAVGVEPKLVFFDLDGTITHRDTLVPFVLRCAARHPVRALRLAGVLPALLRYLLGRADRGELKGALLRAALGGMTREQIAAWTREFVPQLLARGVFRDALTAVRAHLEAGDHLVLMSASVDLYVPDIGRALGFHETVCSRVRWSGDRLDGRLDGPNCRDLEKARQLERIAPRFPGRLIVAYGNSAPDLDHLRLATRAVLVNAPPRLRERAAALPVCFVHWR
jgi:phosphatidylglycerophosphatase C